MWVRPVNDLLNAPSRARRTTRLLDASVFDRDRAMSHAAVPDASAPGRTGRFLRYRSTPSAGHRTSYSYNRAASGSSASMTPRRRLATSPRVRCAHANT